MTPVTPLKSPPLDDLQNALQVCVCYGDKDVADSDAKRALVRVQHLIVSALDKLGEPNERTVEACLRQLGGAVSRDEAWDLCAVVTRTSLTWGGLEL